MANSNGDRGKSWRHFKALMKKNWINWKRTVLGSIFESILPMLLTLLLVWARAEVEKTMYPGLDFNLIQKGFYPTSTLNSTGQWTNTNFDLT
jgi:hypothetical protein